MVDEVNELFPEQEHGSSAYLEAILQRREKCRDEAISHYLDTINQYLTQYFGHLKGKGQGSEVRNDIFDITSMLKLLNRAVSYLSNNWDELTQFTQNYSMATNNNGCEQLVKIATFCRKIRGLDFQSEAEVIHHMNMQSVWLSLETNKINQFEYFARVNHITLMSMIALYARSRAAMYKAPSKRALDACKFKQDVVESLSYNDIVRDVLTTKHITMDEVYHHIAVVATNPFEKDEGTWLNRLNKEKNNKRQLTIGQKQT